MAHIEVQCFRLFRNNTQFDSEVFGKPHKIPKLHPQPDALFLQVDESLIAITRIISLALPQLDILFDDDSDVLLTYSPAPTVTEQVIARKKLWVRITTNEVWGTLYQKVTLTELYKLFLNLSVVDNITEVTTEDLIKYLESEIQHRAKCRDTYDVLENARTVLNLVPSLPLPVALAAISTIS